MSGTPATQVLRRANVAFELHTYAYDPQAVRIGLQAALALGEPPGRVLKTLMAKVDGLAVCVVLPCDREVSMKKLAAAFGGKSAQLMPAADAERSTGYRIGGISPFGQRRLVRSIMEQSAMAEPYIFLNAGRRGLQLRLAPDAARRALNALTAVIVA